MVAHLPVGQGRVTLVDDEDYQRFKDYPWFVAHNGYVVGYVPYRGRFTLSYLHRLVLDAPPDWRVDHCNGDRLDNRRANLRLATAAQNAHHRQPVAASQTGLKGVGWHKARGKYHARIQYQGLRCHLGYFLEAETAALAYDEAARRLFGAFAVLNYPQRETPPAIARSVVERLVRRGLLPGDRRDGGG
ncbi:MAG: HNH endonuclease [Anaerolineae bacterium]